jgi:lysophospholipase L1-like esterase
VLLGVRGGLLRDNYESDYQKLAEETGSAYVPNVLDGLLGEDAYMDDVIHPNEVGYRIIAEKVHLVLREILP